MTSSARRPVTPPRCYRAVWPWLRAARRTARSARGVLANGPALIFAPWLGKRGNKGCRKIIHDHRENKALASKLDSQYLDLAREPDTKRAKWSRNAFHTADQLGRALPGTASAGRDHMRSGSGGESARPP